MAGIQCRNLFVEFPITGGTRSFRGDVLVNKVGGLFSRELAGQTKSKSPNIISVQALRDISLELVSGDRLGLIGHNGAGKSTLLRTLAGGYAPSSGELVINGRVVPLLTLGAGMDGDFTGYENILLCGLHLGMSRREIAAKLDDISTFTELGDFLRLPVRTYSSGMMLRLSFAVATSIDPEILLIDEVFGAGDASFYIKAKRRMEATLERSNVFVLATHSTALIKEYCNCACVLSHGQCVFFGGVDEALSFYNLEVLKG